MKRTPTGCAESAALAPSIGKRSRPGAMLASVKQQINDDQHDERDAEEPSQNILAHVALLVV